MKSIIIALRTSIVFMILCGLVYPLATTGVAQVLFHKQAEGSLVIHNGKVEGSELLAQDFKGAQWFHPRLSAAKYDPTASAATNSAVASKEYIKKAEKNIEQLRGENRNIGSKIPPDLITTSGSGLDPDLSPEAAELQVPRIFKATGIAPDQLIALIKKNQKDRQLGLFGEPRVNILELNIQLEKFIQNKHIIN
ncbi:potassium-transporting ATPase subunit KdpC [Bacillus sp. FSL K6-4563]|uniref:potassium-transporting ATPase subunit KdpC n=1 Tax=Bacillus TaxID=1386 RepID=UPI00227DF7FE|nr:potassium-transporting ATPase subunit KdpC [Bacillus pumilus]MCY7502795.1 potassium-transporting ATPase subunit KdpC [Bacillus pumilus]MCY7529111.1 potassium-transporting ATPase subunit KdpC [Bacillus pumilus]MED4440247.1 potassium-transporting ATPase subunit KdpC [Bacillus pumilus]MED4489073.1 potassium-transporting ATPase subunit KdpC [Bacillus pumilus]